MAEADIDKVADILSLAMLRKQLLQLLRDLFKRASREHAFDTSGEDDPVSVSASDVTCISPSWACSSLPYSCANEGSEPIAYGRLENVFEVPESDEVQIIEQMHKLSLPVHSSTVYNHRTTAFSLSRYSEHKTAQVLKRRSSLPAVYSSTFNNEFVTVERKGRFTVRCEQSAHWQPRTRRGSSGSRFQVIDESAIMENHGWESERVEVAGGGPNAKLRADSACDTSYLCLGS